MNNYPVACETSVQNLAQKFSVVTE